MGKAGGGCRGEPRSDPSAPTIPEGLPSPENDQPVSVGTTTILPMPSARMAAWVCAASIVAGCDFASNTAAAAS